MRGDIILLCMHVYHKWRSYDICFLNYKVWQTEIFVIFGHFFAFSPPWQPGKSKFLNIKKKTKKTPGHICTINGNHMMYGSWDMECYRRNFLSFWTVFCPCTMGPENQNFEKMKRTCKHIFILQMCTINDSHLICFLRYGVQRTEFFVILDHFLPFYPPNNPKNQNFEKMIKTPGDIIILHMCTINDNHMMYDSWDMECDTEFFVILDHFFPFYPSNNQKNQNFEKMKKISGDIVILHRCTINYTDMMYGSWDMECDRQNFLSILWTIFCPFIPLTTWKIKILKNGENPL